MKPILILLERMCFICSALFGMATIVFLLYAFVMTNWHLLVWAAVCFAAAIAECFFGFMAKAIEKDID